MAGVTCNNCYLVQLGVTRVMVFVHGGVGSHNIYSWRYGVSCSNCYLVQLGVTGVVVFVDGVVGGPVVGGDQHPALGLRAVGVAAVKQVAVEEQRVSCMRHP